MTSTQSIYRTPQRWQQQRQRRTVLVLLLVFGLFLFAAPRLSAKDIRVRVEALWNETSFLQEGCEWAGRTFGADAFYDCAEALWTRAPSFAVASDRGAAAGGEEKEEGGARFLTQMQQAVMIDTVARTLAAEHLTDHSFFTLEMDARVYSPAVEAHYATAVQTWAEVTKETTATAISDEAVAPSCACGEPFGVLYTRALSPDSQLHAQLVCSRAALAVARAALAALQQSNSTAEADGDGEAVAQLVSVREVSLPRLDYRYPTPVVAAASDVAAVFVLYGLLGSTATQRLHEAAVEWATQSRGATSATAAQAASYPTLVYFFRHLPVSRTRLCGSSPPSPHPAATTETEAEERHHHLHDREVFLREHWDTPLAVVGYGVTADIKSMEYKVVDEKAAAQQQAKATTTTEGEASLHSTAEANSVSPGTESRVVGGFHVQRLKERYPHLAASLDQLATVVSTAMDSANLKVKFEVWELQNIGLAATQYIREMEDSTLRLEVLKDLVTQFPLYAAALSRIAAQPERLETVQKAQTSGRPRLPPGMSALFIDGWRVEERDLSLFGVLDALRADEVVSNHVKRALTTRLVPHGDDAAAASRAVSTVNVEAAVLNKVSDYLKRAARRGAADGNEAEAASVAAFAIPGQHVLWLNNVETEKRFDGMPRKLTSFFTQVPDITPFPRRNLLNYVFVWNPLRRSHLQMITLIYRFNHQGMMARYGLLLLDPTWSSEIVSEAMAGDGAAPSSLSGDVLAISAVVYHLIAAGRPEAVLEMLVQLLQAAAAAGSSTSDVIASETVQQVCRHVATVMFEGGSLDELVSSVDFVNYYHDTQAMLRRFPLPEYPATLLNGVVLDTFGGGFTAGLEYEVMRLREWVASGALQDGMEDLYTQILQLRGAADHLQPALLRPPRTMLWTETQPVVAFIEDAPYLYSATYTFDVPSLTQILVLPCHSTTATLQQLQTVLAALAACAEMVAGEGKKGPRDAVCRSLRVSVATCPTAATASTAAHNMGNESPSLSARSFSLSHHITALLRQTVQRSGVAEAKRFSILQRYVEHLLKALSTLPIGSAAHRRCSGWLDGETVAAALAHNPLPNDLLARDHSAAAADDDDDVWQRRNAAFWAALESATPIGDVNVTLVTNGRVVTMDSTFSTSDVLEAARQVLPLTKKVEEAVLKVNFAEMTPTERQARFTSEELDNVFYSAKVACLTSVFAREAVAHEAGKSSFPLVREEEIFATAEERKRMRPLLFTVNTTATVGSSGGSNAFPSSAASSVDGEGGVAAAAAAREEGRVLHTIFAVVDPSSRDAQLIVSLAHRLLFSPLRIRLTVLLNPSPDVKFPIRNFYQFVGGGSLAFDTSRRVAAPEARFDDLPPTALLTLGVEEPPTWTVFSQEAEVDLDNVLLSKLPARTRSVAAVYRMHSILVTGDATDTLTGGPPDGLPLSLTPAQRCYHNHHTDAIHTRSTDTQVMANQNGYYQLQAAPGLWYLSVKPGPVAAAYCVEAVDDDTVPSCAEGDRDVNFTQGQRIPVMVDSFSGRYLSLHVRHTPPPLSPTSKGHHSSGRGGSSNVEEEEADSRDLHSILQQMAADVKHTWPPPWRSRGAKPQPPAKPTLNIFSVASGHLYERFLRMMFYSVHRTSSDKYGANTTRIKFWVIENFLSPQFKRYIPLLAAELGFEVGFVTYRWPWWLPRQTEKQRKIWAYKILFLDVLFPLDVDRIIFVDADQTAQADLHELYNMDIGHSPVAMTPFCQANRNEATVKFRFWEHGFWVDHLKGKPYHISAIFLVDLRRFRAMLAGDRYRSTYANLASDPNSLANLDQDLPNYLQASIPIFSLPEQWLWCETWCSAKSKPKAKTIDLCNNPLTKMPKLDNAKMVIPGWEELDNTLQNMSDALLELH